MDLVCPLCISEASCSPCKVACMSAMPCCMSQAAHYLQPTAGQSLRVLARSYALQIAALSSVALLTVELWPNTFAFASDLTKLIGVTICECSLVVAWDVVYLWRVIHDDLPDAYQLLPAVLHASDVRCAPSRPWRGADVGALCAFLCPHCQHLPPKVCTVRSSP